MGGALIMNETIHKKNMYTYKELRTTKTRIKNKEEGCGHV